MRASRRADPEAWMRRVLKSTAIPFALVLVMAGVFGWVAHHYCQSPPS